MENLTKVCSKCKVEKGNLEFYKIKSKGIFNSSCIDCVKESMRDYYKKNSEKRITYNCVYAKNNREKVIEYSRDYYKKNPEKLNEINQKYRKNNQEKVRESQNKWSKKNSDKVNESSRKWAMLNPEKIKELNAKTAKNLGDSYIKRSLKSSGFSKELINNQELIEVKRLTIQIKRLCKTSQI